MTLPVTFMWPQFLWLLLAIPLLVLEAPRPAGQVRQLSGQPEHPLFERFRLPAGSAATLGRALR